MKYGLFAAIALAFVTLVGGAASAGVATSGLANQSIVPAASLVEHIGKRHWKSRRSCYRHCRRHGHSKLRCNIRCKKWWWN